MITNSEATKKCIGNGVHYWRLGKCTRCGVSCPTTKATITERQLKSGRLFWHKYAGQRTYRHEKPKCMLDLPFTPKTIRRVAQSITAKILDCMASGMGMQEAIKEVLS